MKVKHFCTKLLVLLFVSMILPLAAEESQQTETILFTPPKGWQLAKKEELPSHVEVMVIGKGTRGFPPSINLSTEQFEGTLREYLAIVKEINAKHGSDWRDLGSIQTQAGSASLSQADTKTEWGAVRMMHVILKRNGMIYILTAAAHQEEFPKHYKTFFQSLRSLRVADTAYLDKVQIIRK